MVPVWLEDCGTGLGVNHQHAQERLCWRTLNMFRSQSVAIWLKSYLGPSEHCGSISPRVSRFPFGLLFLVSTPFCFLPFFCLLASRPTRALLMHLTDRFQTHPCSLPLQILVLPMAVALTSMVRAPALASQQMRNLMPSFHSLHRSKSRSRRFPLSRVGCVGWNHTSQLQFEDLPPDFQPSIRHPDLLSSYRHLAW